jgi:hypothetical protein
MTDATSTVLVACSVFKPELEELARRGALRFPIRFLDSRLHIRPEVLGQRMAETCRQQEQAGQQIVLVFGDCHADTVDLTSGRNVARVKGLNCGMIVLGKQRYKHLIADGAFLLLPEWAKRWREIVNHIPGLDSALEIKIVREMHAKFVYLDTGVCPVPQEDLEECARYFQLPYEVEEVRLDRLAACIEDALHDLRMSGTET